MKTKYVIQAAIIAAIYALVTLLLAPISYGPIQIRISEALTVLPALTPAGIPGLFIGCLLANILGGAAVPDIVFGSLATLAAAAVSYRLKDRHALVPLPPVIANGIIVGIVVYFMYGFTITGTTAVDMMLCMLSVSAGEAVACYAAGLPLLKLLKRQERIFQ